MPRDRHWGLSNADFGNLTLGQRILEMRKVRTVISGHTHIRREAQVIRPSVPERSTLAVSVLGSDYHAPVYSVIDTAALEGDDSSTAFL